MINVVSVLIFLVFAAVGAAAGFVFHSPPIVIGFLLIGILALCGALTLAEVAGAFPNTGGIFDFIRRAWGRLAAFLFGFGAGAIVQVIVQLSPSLRDDTGRVLHPRTVGGLLAGLTLMFATGLLVSV